MYKALWTGGDIPTEYLELILCRDIYHCTPQQLAQVPLAKLLAHLTCLDVEGQIKKVKRK